MWTVKYGDNPDSPLQINTYTEEVTGEEVLDGTPCYVTEITIDPYAERTRDGVEMTVYGATTWIDKDTLQPLKQVIQMLVGGEPVTATIEYDYASEPEWPLEVGEVWSYVRTLTLDGLEESDERDVVVEGVVEVTVPAGTFSCFEIFDEGAGNLYIWYSVVVKNAVKKIDLFVSYDEIETWELESYSVQP